ncbi:hypothetical protein J0656_19605 [Muricauda ruestringensis]|uniref:DUF4935 domain-containing protein n=1 Tax=Flagellimonas aurea TaxID=2915619 RepID=A0ABS3GAB6_9FLAO|nr:hypothetical protein [Allomuricauda aurea]MBO0356233.1 hypothetical protein [Allomuricauda aurea]
MKKIVTDTNVWYKIGQDYSHFPDEPNVELPIPVLFELFTSQNLTKNQSTFADLKLAIAAILDFKAEIIFNHFNPIQALIKNHYPEYDAKSGVENYLKEFSALRKLSFEDCSTVDLSNFRNVISPTTDYYNKVSVAYKSEIRKIGKSNFHNWDTMPKTKEIVIDLMNSEIEASQLGFPKIQDFDFSRVELFINIFNKQLRDIAITGERMKDNDWNDIFLLVYVNPGSEYWTYEKKWIRKISELGFEKYLYGPQN